MEFYVADRTFPEYWTYVHPQRIPILVQMEAFARARFWEGRKNEWGEFDMDDLAESIDYQHFIDGYQFELVTAEEAEILKVQISSAFS